MEWITDRCCNCIDFLHRDSSTERKAVNPDGLPGDLQQGSLQGAKNGKRVIQDDILIVGSNKVEIEDVLHIVAIALRELRMSGEYESETCDKRIASRLDPKPREGEPKQQSKYLIKSQGKYSES